MSKSVWLWIPILAFSMMPMPVQALRVGQFAAMTRFVESPPGFAAACGDYRWLCSGESGGMAQPPDEALRGLADAVNRDVNREVAQKTDHELYGVAEKWALPAGGSGDCEDLALEKMRRLLDHGVAAERLSMAIVVDRRGDNHAVLLLRLENGALVLDSLTDRLAGLSETGYRMLAMQASEDRARWKLIDRPAIGHRASGAARSPIDIAAGSTFAAGPGR